VAGLLLMPVLGLKRLLVVGALVDIGLGVWLFAVGTRSRTSDAPARRSIAQFAGGSRLTLPVVGTVALLVAIATAARFDLARLTSGVYRHGVVAPAREYTFPYYRDGRTATVSARQIGRASCRERVAKAAVLRSVGVRN